MEFAEETRIPTHLWVEAEVRRLSGEGFGVYVAARGDKTGGMVLQKISDMSGNCRLRGQQRDLLGKLVWIDILHDEIVPESEADAYIRRAVERDPDLWVVEIEDRAMQAALVSGHR
ncbi:MAG TPA: DUF1491 family protein [Micavibrio sp.]|nr:DUF1491 family protein [Micavibrio sp.]